MRVLIAALLLAASAQAKLEWETREVALTPALGAEQAEALFTFTNRGSSVVTLQSVTSSCGCTVPKMEKMTYAPGESGVVRALFTIGSRTGRQTSSVTVVSDDATEGRTLLSLVVNIPMAVDMQPRVVYWNVGEASDERILLVKAHPEAGIKAVGIKSEAEGFTVDLREGEAPLTWEVVIRPVDTSQRRRATYELLTDAPNGTHLSFFAFIR